ncbi:hypothetical protein [Salmonella phage SSBI34]|nr:hypothetical protein [Salmonella phage SSBI34]
MQQTKYYIEGVQAAHNGAGRFCRYRKPENVEQWEAGYDSVERSHMVIRFNSKPTGKPLTAYQERPDPVYMGTLRQCQDRAVSLSIADRLAYFEVYTKDGEKYEYQSKV